LCVQIAEIIAQYKGSERFFVVLSTSASNVIELLAV